MSVTTRRGAAAPVIPPISSPTDAPVTMTDVASLAHRIANDIGALVDRAAPSERRDVISLVIQLAASRLNEVQTGASIWVGCGAIRGLNMSNARPIEPWAADLILSGVNRLDNAITALGCVMGDLDDSPESDTASEVEAIRWLYEMLRDEAQNIRYCVRIARNPNSDSAQMLQAAAELAA